MRSQDIVRCDSRGSVFEYGKNSRRDRFTDVDSTVRDGYVDESVPGSNPGSANGLRASSRWEYPTVPKEPIEVGYHIQAHCYF